MRQPIFLCPVNLPSLTPRRERTVSPQESRLSTILNEIYHPVMKISESVNKYYDRLNSYIGGTKAALEAAHTHAIDVATSVPVMQTAIKSFSRGLPDDLSSSVDAKDPVTLGEPSKFAKHTKERRQAGGMPHSAFHTSCRSRKSLYEH